MEGLVVTIILILFLCFLVMKANKKTITDWKNDRRAIKARKAIEDTGEVLGVEHLVYDLLHKGIIDSALSLNCRELIDPNIDRAIKSLSPYLEDNINEGLPVKEKVAVWLLLGLCYIKKKNFHKAINLLTRLGKSSAMWVAYCYSEIKEYNKAVKTLQDLPDEDIDSKLLLAICFTELGEYEPALTVLKKVIIKRKLFNESPNKLKILSTL